MATAKPRKGRVRGGILIILARTEILNAALYSCLIIFAASDTNDANWPSTLTNLAVAIESTNADMTANELTTGEIETHRDAVQTALNNYNTSEG